MRSVELFVGAGGLGLGIGEVGFRPVMVADWDHDSCETIRENQRRGVRHVKNWPLVESDVRALDFAQIPEGIDLLAGGPPCQPFSICGKHQGYEDDRDMFPEVARAVRTIKPRAFLVENVRGLTRPKFARYLSYILLQLTYPDIAVRAGEGWQEHVARLERHHTRGGAGGLSYRVAWRVLNAADYGIPQQRWRVVIVGFRSDLCLEWSFPQATHSREALLHDQFVTGDYWERHRVPKRHRSEAPASMRATVERTQGRLLPNDLPWRTVRDAIADLPKPSKLRTPSVANHRFIPGARSYIGHTGSPYDWPAKALKAGDHGVPGGENMLVDDQGKVRYFSVREAARLQTFPDEYTFPVSWSESMRQIGNAVPVRLGQLIAAEIARKLTAH